MCVCDVAPVAGVTAVQRTRSVGRCRCGGLWIRGRVCCTTAAAGWRRSGEGAFAGERGGCVTLGVCAGHVDLDGIAVLVSRCVSRSLTRREGRDGTAHCAGKRKLKVKLGCFYSVCLSLLPPEEASQSNRSNDHNVGQSLPHGNQIILSYTERP